MLVVTFLNMYITLTLAWSNTCSDFYDMIHMLSLKNIRHLIFGSYKYTAVWRCLDSFQGH